MLAIPQEIACNHFASPGERRGMVAKSAPQGAATAVSVWLVLRECSSGEELAQMAPHVGERLGQPIDEVGPPALRDPLCLRNFGTVRQEGCDEDEFGAAMRSDGVAAPGELCQGFRTVSRLIPSVVQAACAAVR